MGFADTIEKMKSYTGKPGMHTPTYGQPSYPHFGQPGQPSGTPALMPGQLFNQTTQGPAQGATPFSANKMGFQETPMGQGLYNYIQQNKTGQPGAAGQPGQKSLFGEDIEQPWNLLTARGNIMEGIQESMKPHFQEARSQYQQRGLGRIYAPAVKSSLETPLIKAGAEATRKALGDVFFKEQYLDLAQRGQDVSEAELGMKTEEFDTKMSGGKVICTALVDLGLLDAKIVALDIIYVKKFIKDVTADALRGYYWWAIPYAKKMLNGSTLRAKLICWWAKTWAYETASRIDSSVKSRWWGKPMYFITQQLCFYIGKVAKLYGIKPIVEDDQLLYVMHKHDLYYEIPEELLGEKYKLKAEAI